MFAVRQVQRGWFRIRRHIRPQPQSPSAIPGSSPALAKRCPDPVPGGEYEIEIRQVFETSDFETMTPELKEKEEELRAAIESRQR